MSDDNPTLLMMNCFNDVLSDEARNQLIEQLPGTLVFMNFDYTRPIGHVESAALEDGRVSVHLDLEQLSAAEIDALAFSRRKHPDIGISVVPTFIIEEKTIREDVTEITKLKLIETSITINPLKPADMTLRGDSLSEGILPASLHE